MPALVIFDCDGVLVDSETIACRVDAACLAEAGFFITADEVMERYVGVSAAAMLADIERRHGRALPAGFHDTLQARLAEAFDKGLAAMPGIETALSDLRGRCCVASSSTPERLRHSLAVTRLTHHFEPHIFSATQVARGKPAPDLFLFAAEQVGVAARDCLVIEDSLAGVRAGVTAGMRVFGFIGGGHCRPGHDARLQEAGAALVFDDMRRLGAMI